MVTLLGTSLKWPVLTGSSMAEFDIPNLIRNLGLSLSQAAPETQSSAREMITNPDAPQPLAASQLPEASPWLDLFQTGMAAAGAAGLFGEGSQQLGQLNQKLMEKRRIKKASDETQALTGIISTALSSGNPEQLSSVVKQMSGLKGLEPETVEALKKVQIDLGEKLQAQNRTKQVADFVGSLPSPQAKAVSNILNLDPTQKLAETTRAVKDLVVDTTANVVDFKSLPDKIKTQVFIEAADMKVDPNQFLDLARRGDPMAAARLDRAVSSIGTGQTMNAHDRMATVMYGPRGLILPLGVRSFAELSLKQPSAAKQVMSEVRSDEARAAAIQKGVIVEAQLETQLRVENAQPPKINQYWIDKDKLKSDPGLPMNNARVLDRSLGEIRRNPERFTELDDQQRRQIESFNGIEAVLSEIETIVPGLPARGGLGALVNRAKNPIQRYLGTSGIANEVGTMQFGSLFLGRVFQGAASQLSDRDVAMAAYANINDGDSQASITQKIGIVRRLSQRFKLAMAGVDIRKMKPAFSEDEFKSAVSKFGAPSTPVPGTRAFIR